VTHEIGKPQYPTRCTTPQHTATHCNTLQHTVTHCNTLQHTVTHWSTLHHTTTRCNTLQHRLHKSHRRHKPETNIWRFLPLQHVTKHCNIFPAHYNSLHHLSINCNTLQHTATDYISLQRRSHTVLMRLKFEFHNWRFPQLQHTGTYCNTLPTHYNSLKLTATHFTTLQHTATHYNSLQHRLHTSLMRLNLESNIWRFPPLQHTAIHCNTRPTHYHSLHRISTHYNTLQHTATARNNTGYTQV